MNTRVVLEDSCLCGAYSVVLSLRFVGDPLVGDGHEVALHGEGETLAVLRGLDDGGLGLASNHADTLAHALHLLNNVVLYT